MKLIFENSSEDFDQHKQLALELNFEIVDVKQIDEIKSYKDTYFFVISEDRLFIKKGLSKNAKPIFSDFDAWFDNYDDKLLQNCLKTLPKNFNCLDLTAGFAKEVEDVNQYPEEIYSPTAGAIARVLNFLTPRIVIIRPNVAINSLK